MMNSEAGELGSGGILSQPFKQALMSSPILKDAEEFSAVERRSNLSGEPLLKATLEENQVLKEEIRLKSIGLFLVALGAIPARDFLEDWIDKQWRKNNILFDSFRYLENGVFMVRFQKPEMAKRVLDKNLWYCENSLFKAISWDPDADITSLRRRSEIEQSEKILNSANVRFLLVPKYNRELPKEIRISTGDKISSFELITLGGLDTCYYCKKPGHTRGKCPRLLQNKSLDKINFPPLRDDPVFERNPSVIQESSKKEEMPVEANVGTCETGNEELNVCSGQSIDLEPLQKKMLILLKDVVRQKG
eukprot:Gb_08287 [translate_table: standard]